MWLVTKYGFYSVVAHRDDPDLVLVRGRNRDDMETLRGFAQGRGIQTPELLATPEADYCCRMFMPRMAWGLLGAALAAEIDYVNFKDQVHGDPVRDAAYMQMWAAMRRFQAQKAGTAVTPAWTEPGWDYFQPALDDLEEWDGLDEWTTLDEGDDEGDDDEPDEAEVFDFLDMLRDSGITNMFGARPYLQEEFGFDKQTAAEWLTNWMQTYAGRHGLEDQHGLEER